MKIVTLKLSGCYINIYLYIYIWKKRVISIYRVSHKRVSVNKFIYICIYTHKFIWEREGERDAYSSLTLSNVVFVDGVQSFAVKKFQRGATVWHHHDSQYIIKRVFGEKFQNLSPTKLINNVHYMYLIYILFMAVYIFPI